MDSLPPEPRIDARYLTDLENATRRYAYLVFFSGLGRIPAGFLWVGAGLAFRRGDQAIGQLMMAFSVPVAAVCSAHTHRWYQRHGVVRPASQDVVSSKTMLVMAALMIVVTMLGAIFPRTRDGLDSLMFALVWLVALSTTAVVLWPDRSDRHWVSAQLAFVVLALVFGDGHGGRAHWELIALGTFFVVAGLVSHVLYRRIERRLAALRARA